MIDVVYNSEGIKVTIGKVSKYNKNLPFKLIIKKHVSGEEQWSTLLNDNWYGIYPNTEMFDVEIIDSQEKIIYEKNGMLWNTEIIFTNLYGCIIKI